MAQKRNLNIDQGTTFQVTIDLDVELLNLDGFASFRRSYTANSGINFVVETNSEMGVITLSLTPNQTVNLKPGQYVWDAYLADNAANTSYRVLEGILTLNPRVTKMEETIWA